MLLEVLTNRLPWWRLCHRPRLCVLQRICTDIRISLIPPYVSVQFLLHKTSILNSETTILTDQQMQDLLISITIN